MRVCAGKTFKRGGQHPPYMHLPGDNVFRSMISCFYITQYSCVGKVRYTCMSSNARIQKKMKSKKVHNDIGVRYITSHMYNAAHTWYTYIFPMMVLRVFIYLTDILVTLCFTFIKLKPRVLY